MNKVLRKILAERKSKALEEESPIQAFKNAAGKKIFQKEYEAALELLATGKVKNAADAAKRFKHVDARTLQDMIESVELDEARDKVAPLEKKLSKLQDSLSLATERRKRKGERLQSPREVKLYDQIADVRDQIDKAKAAMKESVELAEGLTVPPRLQKWADEKRYIILATKAYRQDRSSLHFLAQDSRGNDRDGILMKSPNERGQYIELFNGEPNLRQWVNAMTEEVELDEAKKIQMTKAQYLDVDVGTKVVFRLSARLPQVPATVIGFNKKGGFDVEADGEEFSLGRNHEVGYAETMGESIDEAELEEEMGPANAEKVVRDLERKAKASKDGKAIAKFKSRIGDKFPMTVEYKNGTFSYYFNNLGYNRKGMIRAVGEGVLVEKKIPVELDPNKKYTPRFDKDNDGDYDELDANTPDEITGTDKTRTAKMMKKYEKEKQHTKVGVAYESVKLDEARYDMFEGTEAIKIGDTITYYDRKGKTQSGVVAKKSTNSPKGYFLDDGTFVSKQSVLSEDNFNEARSVWKVQFKKNGGEWRTDNNAFNSEKEARAYGDKEGKLYKKDYEFRVREYTNKGTSHPGQYRWVEEVDLDEARYDMFEGTHFKAGDTVIDTNTKMKGIVLHKGNRDEIYVKFGSINKAIKASELRLAEEVTEEVAANSVAGGGVDMNPTGMKKRDKRKKEDTEQMYRRNLGLGPIRKILKARNA